MLILLCIIRGALQVSKVHLPSARGRKNYWFDQTDHTICQPRQSKSKWGGKGGPFGINHRLYRVAGSRLKKQPIIFTPDWGAYIKPLDEELRPVYTVIGRPEEVRHWCRLIVEWRSSAPAANEKELG